MKVKNIYKIFLACLFFFALFGCNDREAEEILMAHIMEVHDDLMKKGDNIMQNKESLNKLLASSANADSVSASLDTEKFHQKVNALNQELTQADEAMMNWMKGFDPGTEGKTHEQIMASLNKQQESLLKVEVQTNKALEKSNAFLKQYAK